jgi:hypothetical protein
VFIQFLRRYCLKLIFALGLLIGLQLPHFLQQYEHRLDAHYLESQSQLQQYQDLADLYFLGNIKLLIAKHRQSDDLVFRKEAKIIEDTANRFAMFEAKKQALKGGLLSRLFYLIGEFNTPLFIETQHNYKAEIVLNRDAIIVGLVSGLMSSLLLDGLFMLFIYKFKLIYYFYNKKKPKKVVN